MVDERILGSYEAQENPISPTINEREGHFLPTQMPSHNKVIKIARPPKTSKIRVHINISAYKVKFIVPNVKMPTSLE
jgi:hypothetical protein